MKGSFYIISTSQGCVSNFNEEALYADYLIKAGLTRANSEVNAELVIVNSCSHLPSTKETTEAYITKFHNCKHLIVTGCLPLMYKGEFNKLNIHHFKPGDISELAALVGITYKNIALNDNDIVISSTGNFDPYQKVLLFLRPKINFYFANYLKRNQYLKNFIDTVTISSDFFVIRTGMGCMGNCTFCGIKRSKGRIKSKTLGYILSEIDKAKSQNSKLICLSGEDIGCWGQDINSSTVYLLENILKNLDDEKLIIEYFDPEWLIRYQTELAPIFANEKIACVTFALQSGSSRIVNLMGRKYDPRVVCSTIKKIKRENPSLIVKSNTIVGFPQENWKDFWETIVSFFYYDGSSVDSFGLVSGTEAAGMSGQISSHVKSIRLVILHILNLLIIFYNITFNLLNFRIFGNKKKLN